MDHRGTAFLTKCSLLSHAAPRDAPPLPPLPKPGFLPSVAIVPATVEVRGAGSVVRACDCKMGLADEGGWRCVGGGELAREDGVAAALAPLATHFADFL